MAPGFSDLRVERAETSATQRKIRWGDPEPYQEAAVAGYERTEFGALIRGRYVGYSERAIEKFVAEGPEEDAARDVFLRRPGWADGPLFLAGLAPSPPSIEIFELQE